MRPHYSFAVNTNQYDIHSRELPKEEAEKVMDEATASNHKLRNNGMHSDFSHFIEPNGSGYEMVQLIDSGDSYTPIYFHIGEEVEKKGRIEWDEVEERLSYDPRKV